MAQGSPQARKGDALFSVPSCALEDGYCHYHYLYRSM